MLVKYDYCFQNILILSPKNIKAIVVHVVLITKPVVTICWFLILNKIISR
jgi:hypothetical protein